MIGCYHPTRSISQSESKYPSRSYVGVIDREPLVGVDGDAEEAGVGVDKEALVAGFQVVDHSSLGKVGHIGHVLNQLVFWRILLLNVLNYSMKFIRFRKGDY